jgi:hypothetical protein
MDGFKDLVIIKHGNYEIYLSASTPKAAEPITMPAKCIVPTKDSFH